VASVRKSGLCQQRVTRDQLVEAGRSQPAPVARFVVVAGGPENARELRSVIGIVRGQSQGPQAGNGGIALTRFRFGLGEMALRRREGEHQAPCSSCILQSALVHPHQSELVVERRQRKR